MKKFFNYLFTRSSGILFISAIFSSGVLTLSFFLLAYEYPGLLSSEVSVMRSKATISSGLRFQDFTILGKFYLFSGIIPNFLFLILIYRLIKFLLVTFLIESILVILLQFVKRILGIIFSNKNFDRLEKVIKTNKPAIKETVEKLDIKKVVDDLGIKKSEYEIFWIAPIVALVIGFLPMPFGYYIISRLIVSGCALYFAVKFYKQQDNFKPWIFGFLVVLYNPIIPMPLGSKELWLLVNIPTMYYFFINRKF